MLTGDGILASITLAKISLIRGAKVINSYLARMSREVNKLVLKLILIMKNKTQSHFNL